MRLAPPKSALIIIGFFSIILIVVSLFVRRTVNDGFVHQESNATTSLNQPQPINHEKQSVTRPQPELQLLPSNPERVYELTRELWDTSSEQLKTEIISGDAARRIASLACLISRYKQYPDDVITAMPLPDILAAADLIIIWSGIDDAAKLISEWTGERTTPRTVAQMAHALLIADDLPYGGGIIALDYLEAINDQAATIAGLYQFASDYDLDPALRIDALIRLKRHTPASRYNEVIQQIVEATGTSNEMWAPRIHRVTSWLKDPELAQGPLTDERRRSAVIPFYPGVFYDLMRFEQLTGPAALRSPRQDKSHRWLPPLDDTQLTERDWTALKTHYGYD